jgi:hypothetical protein
MRWNLFLRSRTNPYSHRVPGFDHAGRLCRFEPAILLNLGLPIPQLILTYFSRVEISLIRAFLPMVPEWFTLLSGFHLLRPLASCLEPPISSEKPFTDMYQIKFDHIPLVSAFGLCLFLALS